MHKTVLSILFLMLALFSIAQKNNDNCSNSNSIANNPTSTDSTITKVDKLPVYIGRSYYHLKMLLIYTKYADKYNLAGNIIFGFTVTSDGIAKDFRVIKGIRTDLDNELLKCMKQMTKWEPAEINGVKIEMYHTFTPSFRSSNVLDGVSNF